MSKEHNPIQKSNRHTAGGSSTARKMQPPKLSLEELEGIREKLRPHRHNRYVERLYNALIQS